ncbi:EamA family transporter [Actinomycetes bacterium M1A6_2h]
MTGIEQPRDDAGRLPTWSIPLVFVVGGLFQYLGAAIGVFLFDTTEPAAVAWLRAAGAAVVLLVWRRPFGAGRRWTRRTSVIAGGFGVVTVGMNLVFYEAIARIPLGTAVAIEFVGPVAVAALGSRRGRDVVALLMVAAGVLSVAGATFDGDTFDGSGIVGVGFALASAALWAAYVVLGKRVADRGDGLDSLAVGITIAAVVLAPVALWPQFAVGAGVLLHPVTWVLGIGVGLLSSVIPYALDQVVLKRVGRARFALLLALLPTTATVVGVVVLRQVPTALEVVGIALVVAAVVLGGTGLRGPVPPP